MTTVKERTGVPVDVVCALIIEGGKLLIVQYGPGSKHPGQWEFPGGKVHAGESPEEALSREITEELGIQVNILYPLEPVEYEYSDRLIRLIPFVCRYERKTIVLQEHQALLWLELKDLNNFGLLPADRKLLDSRVNSGILKQFLSKTEGGE